MVTIWVTPGPLCQTLMSAKNESLLPADFSGQVRLFPLPNLVMFPHGLQPLQVREGRYCQMLEDALANDCLLTMALLQPGWETDYEQRPAIFPVTCIAHIVSHSRLEDGHYNILLRGLKRASVVRENPASHPYRKADVVVLEDLYSASAKARRAEVKRRLLSRFCDLLPPSAVDQQLIGQLQEKELRLGVLTDIISFAIPFEIAFKQRLLCEWNVDVRAGILLERLDQLEQGVEPASGPFPPKFSDN
jgi:ATP-dependent Lon protease